jgi:ATP-dependent Lon protease
VSSPENVGTLPVLPIKNAALFPMMLLPLTVGRATSIAAIEAALATEEKEIVVVAQRDASVEEPNLSDLYAIGTKAVLKKMARKPDNLLDVVLLGVERAVVLKLDKPGDYYAARVKPLPLSPENNAVIEALHRAVTDLAIRALALTQPQAAEELRRLLSNSKDPIKTVYTLAPMFSLELEKEQSLLEAPTVGDALRLMHSYLTHELQVLEIRNRIASQAQTEMSKEQRDYLLRQQMRAIQKELSGEDSEQSRPLCYVSDSSRLIYRRKFARKSNGS